MVNSANNIIESYCHILNNSNSDGSVTAALELGKLLEVQKERAAQPMTILCHTLPCFQAW